MEKNFEIVAKAFMSALDKIGKLVGEDFDYFDMACELLDGYTNSEVLEFLDTYGGSEEDGESI